MPLRSNGEADSVGIHRSVGVYQADRRMFPSSQLAMRAIIGIRCMLALIATLLFTFQQGLAQNTSQQELLKLAATDPPYVNDALVTSLPEEGLQAEVIQKLLQFLDDDRMVVEHLMGRETVSSRVAMKLHLLASTSVETIVDELPKLTTNRSKQLALEVIASIGGPNAEAYSALLPWCYENDVVLRSRAIAALSAVGVDDSTTVQQLGRFLKDPHPYVRGITIETLIPKHHLVDPFLKEIISLLDDESEVFLLASKDMMISQRIQESVAKMLALKGPSVKAALPRLWVLTGADYPTNVRIWSAAGLCNVAESPPEEAMQLLGQLLLLDRDEEFWMNDAPEAIAILGGKGKSLLENFEQAKSHKSAAMRSRLSEAFFALDPATAISRILR